MAQDSYQASKVLQTNNGSETQFKFLDSSNQSYFSGLDASIYVGINGVDLYLGEVVNIQYQLNEMVKPIFRYPDYVFAEDIHGSRIAAGNFTVNFQQTYLIYMILEHLRGLREGRSGKVESKGITPKKSSIASANNPTAPNPQLAISTAMSALSIPEMSIATTAADTYIQSRTPQNQKKLISAINAVTTASKSNATFQKILNQNKIDQNWIKGQFSGPTPNSPGGSLLARVKANLTPLFSRLDVPGGFQLSIVFGDMNKQEYVETYQPTDPENGYIPRSFEDIHKGMSDHIVNNDVESALEAMPPYTVKKLHGVALTSFGQSIDDSGRPILETYEFIAKDVI